MGFKLHPADETLHNYTLLHTQSLHIFQVKTTNTYYLTICMVKECGSSRAGWFSLIHSPGPWSPRDLTGDDELPSSLVELPASAGPAAA